MFVDGSKPTSRFYLRQHDLTRRFFMRCEAPDSLRLGEQVGVRCALFNKWEQYIEVMVMLHGNEKYRWVHDHGGHLLIYTGMPIAIIIRESWSDKMELLEVLTLISRGMC